MPAIFYPIAVFLAYITSKLVSRVLFSLGMGVLIYTGVDTAIESLKSNISSSWGGIGADIIGVAQIAGIGEAISILISAYAGVLTTQMIAGTLKKLTFVPQQEGA